MSLKTKRMENQNNSGKLIGSLLIGAAIGAALGILFAPDKGTETRKKIAGKSDDLTDAIKDKFQLFLDEIKDEVAMLKEKAQDMSGHTKSN